MQYDKHPVFLGLHFHGLCGQLHLGVLEKLKVMKSNGVGSLFGKELPLRLCLQAAFQTEC